jgi:polyhydroxybutyrate depolymerase
MNMGLIGIRHLVVSWGLTLALAIGMLGASQPPATTETLQQFTLVWDGAERSYFVHYPGNKPPAKPKPVVFVLHGGGGADAEEMARRTGLNRLADREDFLVVYPMGIDGQWNDGRGKTFRQAKDNTHVDDVGFIGTVIHTFICKGHADPSRIYVMGLSNGGMMTYRLGVELGDRLAAIAAVIANLPENIAQRKPVRGLPVLIMNGTDDPMMPWNGGAVRVLGREFGSVLSTEQTVRYWVEAAHLPPKPKTHSLEDRDPQDHCTVQVEQYQAEGNPVEVILYRIQGGGHNLPGGNTPDRPLLLGRKCLDINGPEVIWSFFKRHCLPTNKPAEKPHVQDAANASWRPKVRQVGDPKADYLNVEFTNDGRYMIWFEGLAGSSVNGIVWHCGVNQQTGDLIPPDGRGFRAFESTSWARANPGYDKDGPYYIGADREGYLILVRPESPTQGKATKLPTPPDPRRRAVYPTCLPNRTGGFVFFIQNEKTPGAGVRATGNSWVELQYISLSDPAKVIPIERQEAPPVGFAPMDVGFLRWMHSRPILTYGALSSRTQKVEVRAFDADQTGCKPFDLIVDGRHHIDPYPAVIGEHEYIFTGIDGTTTSHIYRRPAGKASDTPFELFKTLAPADSRLIQPALAQSHEPFLFQGKLYTVYQVNDRGQGFFETTFRKPGEIWLADLSGDQVRQWLIAPDSPGPVAEPEPLITQNHVWVFYSRPMMEELPSPGDVRATPSFGGSLQETLRQRFATSARFRGVPRMALYRAEVPLDASR